MRTPIVATLLLAILMPPAAMAACDIGIRGTDFWGGLSLTPDALEVVMLEGKGVYVRNASGRTELQEAGSGTTVTAGNAPTAPASWPAEKVQRAVQTITP